MKRILPLVLAFALFFLFFIQLAGSLLESIYILDLMNTSLDAKALGVLLFFAPALLMPFRRKFPAWTAWLLFAALFLARGLTPSLPTFGRLLASGIGTGAALLLFPFLATARAKGSAGPHTGLPASVGLAAAVGLSVLLRTLDYSLDASLTPSGAWIGWGLGLVFAWTLTQLNWTPDDSPRPGRPAVTLPVLGIFLVLTLVYFAFSAPAVIARWTEAGYAPIVGAVSLLSAGWAVLALGRPGVVGRLSRRGLALWNGLFTLSLVGTILAHRASFPPTPASPAVIVGTPAWFQQIPLVLMLLLFPALFVDFRLFFGRIAQARPTPRELVPGMLLGSLALVVLVFINVFTNVWGYIAPVSTPFRNLFWLPFLLAAGLLTWLATGRKSEGEDVSVGLRGMALLGWTVPLAAVFLVTAVAALLTDRPRPGNPDKTSLLVLTYNIQAGNDAAGERSYDRQLAVIRQASPDLVALQESDTARLSLNNDDYVRYFAGKLGYYSYYGPATVTGTFGTAILSRYPLRNSRSVFTFSDRDEIGTAEAEIEVGGQTFSIHDVHPDGSDTAKLAFARSLVDRTEGVKNVIILGDFNLRDTEAAYQLVAAVYDEAWLTVYPTKIGPDGTDMSGRIDHIFVSPDLTIHNPTYLPPPASASDHPVHWATVEWEK
ncbi:MAG TPA: endonuclease/exonuclease/phosphatase family protein [Anaerolineales bacterium]|nr:endonuclease/exonuclease/phosphatase family protein [Anaerolineales bacterium]